MIFLGDSLYAAAWRLRSPLRRMSRLLARKRRQRAMPQCAMVSFLCNICGHADSLPAADISRESGICLYCGSTVRFRSIAHALAVELLGETRSLPSLPTRKDIRGIGLSDWLGYAELLRDKFSYKNTYYHKHPRLDICDPEHAEHGLYDFVISSDVFEHVPPPVDRAFEGAFKLLKPGGLLICSVPSIDGTTDEHFPELHRFSLHKTKDGGQYTLSNLTADGRKQEFTDLVFHGGSGSTLEMRVFGKESLRDHFMRAGFEQPRTYGDNVPELGIFWDGDNRQAKPTMQSDVQPGGPPYVARRPL
jgi:SAM-dependent methyltransferase